MMFTYWLRTYTAMTQIQLNMLRAFLPRTKTRRVVLRLVWSR